MLLVAGATGFLGREICRLLATGGHPVRGLTRPASDPDAIALLRQWGVDPVLGDLKDRASLDDVCRGVDTVISTVTATRTRQPGDGIESTDYQGQVNLVDAASDAGASRFVYISFSDGFGANGPLAQAKRGVEQRLRESRMAWTILRPTFFMDVWLGPALGFDYGNAVATLYGAGENAVSWIARDDVAEFAVRCLQTPQSRNATIELGGPEALSPLEVVRVFEEESGRPFEIRKVPEEALQAKLAAATNSMEQTFASLMLAYASGDAIEMTETLKNYPVELRTVKEYARRALQ